MGDSQLLEILSGKREKLCPQAKSVHVEPKGSSRDRGEGEKEEGAKSKGGPGAGPRVRAFGPTVLTIPEPQMGPKASLPFFSTPTI